MSFETIILVSALILGFYMAWSIGANDVANAMGTSVGSGALTLRNALIVAAILEFSGAFFVGANVTETIEKGLLNTEMFASNPKVLLYGMLASLLATGIWLQIASYNGWPVSTTHCIIGAVVGFGLILGGIPAIDWDILAYVGTSWIASPILGGLLSFIIFTILRRHIFYTADPVVATKRLTPFLVFSVFFILTLVTLFKGLSHLNLHLPIVANIGISIFIGLVAAAIAFFLVKRIKINPARERDNFIQDVQMQMSLSRAIKHMQRVKENARGDLKNEIQGILDRSEKLADSLGRVSVRVESSEYITVEKVFVYLQIISACCMAFAHGANDVANAIGPLASIFSIMRQGTVQISAGVPAWMLALGGVGIVVGLATWGWRVIETIGKKLTELTPSRGFAAEFGAATTILLASKLGLPISTTHTLVGSVLGVGLARGIGALNLSMIRDIFLSWIITIPVGALLSVLFYFIISMILG